MEKSLVKKGEEAFNLHREIVAMKGNINAEFIYLGMKLAEMRNTKYYKKMGHENFESYIADPEISFSRSTAFSLMQIYDTLIVKKGFKIERVAEVDYSKILKILPMVDKSDFDEWMEKAKHLSRANLDEEVREAGGKPICEHKEFEQVKKCLKCKKIF